MSDDPFQILVNLLYANKQTKSYTLVLGPGLSFTPALWQKVGKPCASWGEFYDIIETMKREDYTALLKDHFATLQLQDGYQALAQLILEGYFKVVFTMNIDTFLEEAIEHAIKALPDGSKAVKRLFRGKNASDKYDFEHLFDKQISTDLEHLSAEQNAICWLRGHMGGQYYGILSEIIYFLESAKAELRPWSLESVVKGYLSKNVLLVGFIRDADLDISRCLSKIGGAIWYVSPDPEPTDLSSDRCNGKVISGTEADFNTFFRSLAEALQRKDLMSSKSEPQRDFFISYNSRDRQWGEWIAWQLEQAGHSVYIQAWDFLPGNNFVLEMQRAASQSKRTIAVLSKNYLDARFTQAEWAAAFAQDPTGEQGILLPVRVREYDPPGILKSIIYIDLVGSDEAEAQRRLLNGVKQERSKPDASPLFPGLSRPEEALISAIKSDPLLPERPPYPRDLLPTTEAIKVFYVYSSTDEDLRKQIEAQLGLLRIRGVISEWHSGKLIAGTEWAVEIKKRWQEARVILLLISADFMSPSNYQIAEQAVERHHAGTAVAIPIILRPVDWEEAVFSKLTVLPDNQEPITLWSNRDAALLNVARGIRKAIEQLMPAKD